MRTNQAFWDSSAIVPLCCQQATSHPLRQTLRQTSRVIAWWGASVEVHSALNRLVREGDISHSEQQAAVNRLKVLRTSWAEIAPTTKVRELAEEMLDKYVLRAMDSFQLAAALAWCDEKPKGRMFVPTIDWRKPRKPSVLS